MVKLRASETPIDRAPDALRPESGIFVLSLRRGDFLFLLPQARLLTRLLVGDRQQGETMSTRWARPVPDAASPSDGADPPEACVVLGTSETLTG